MNNSFVKLACCIVVILCLANVLSGQDKKNQVSSKQYSIKLNPTNGALESFVRNGRELIFKSPKSIPLFYIRFRNDKGVPFDISSLDAYKVTLSKKKIDTAYIFEIKYESFKDYDLTATAFITCPFNSSLTYWNFSINNETNYLIDQIDYPNVIVPNDLIAKGGDARLFRPSMEGVLVEDADLRNDTWNKPSALSFPATGWVGYYPASCPMQFMAYYGNKAGLYFAAHDTASNIKGLEYYAHDDGGIELKIRFFPGAVGKGNYKIPYPMVIGAFNGNWYDAADIYRNWISKTVTFKWPKLLNNKKIPAWFEKSPVVVSYPIKGSKDNGFLKVNEEYYPYSNALPIIDTLTKAFDSKVLTLLMHWEGSAPWAPPYIWPPYGGVDNYNQFVKSMHSRGNVVGLYASGTGYTLKSYTDTTYNMEKEFREKNLKDIVCIAPDGMLANNGVCSGGGMIRDGYDMCPSTPFVKDVLSGELEKILTTETDYVQLFDQNLGGLGYFCYSKNHGHSHGPGLWMKEEMLKIYSRMNKMIEQSGRKVLLGCEAAAAEPFIPYLLFNDLRAPINYSMGVPVPAYSYVFHEYTNSFAGNANSYAGFVNISKSPLNLHQRLAYAFTAGDLFTVVLGRQGAILWDWPTAEPKMDQASVKLLIKNMNAWRTGAGKPFLVYGKMEKPLPIEGSVNIPMITIKEKQLPFESILTSKWKSQDGRRAQVLVNYTPQEQTCTVKNIKSKKVILYKEANGKAQQPKLSVETIEIKIPALSAVMVEFID